MAVYGHPESANLAYLGLYAQQHRGQESAGISVSNGREIYTHKSMGHVADIFTLTLKNGGLKMVYNPAYKLPDDVKALADKTVSGLMDGSIKTGVK